MNRAEAEKLLDAYRVAITNLVTDPGYLTTDYNDFNADAVVVAREALIAAMTRTQWQPIETAPHEKMVLLYCQASTGNWTEAAYASQGWSRHGVSTISRHGHATHWMPLPEPPAESQSKEPDLGGALEDIAAALLSESREIPEAEVERQARRTE